MLEEGPHVSQNGDGDDAGGVYDDVYGGWSRLNVSIAGRERHFSKSLDSSLDRKATKPSLIRWSNLQTFNGGLGLRKHPSTTMIFSSPPSTSFGIKIIVIVMVFIMMIITLIVKKRIGDPIGNPNLDKQWPP